MDYVYHLFSLIHEAPKPASLQKTELECPPVPDPSIVPESLRHHPSGAVSQNGADTHPDPVRQLLQDELFRLVQVSEKQS